MLTNEDKAFMRRWEKYNPIAQELVALDEADKICLDTIVPLYHRLRSEKAMTKERTTSLYTYVEELHCQLKYNLRAGKSPVTYKLQEPVRGASFHYSACGVYADIMLELLPLLDRISIQRDRLEAESRSYPQDHISYDWQVENERSELINKLGKDYRIPPDYKPYVQEAVYETFRDYSDQGLRLKNAQVVVIGGTHHPIDSTPQRFKVATHQAVCAAINIAKLRAVH